MTEQNFNQISPWQIQDDNKYNLYLKLNKNKKSPQKEIQQQQIKNIGQNYIMNLEYKSKSNRNNLNSYKKLVEIDKKKDKNKFHQKQDQDFKGLILKTSEIRFTNRKLQKNVNNLQIIRTKKYKSHKNQNKQIKWPKNQQQPQQDYRSLKHKIKSIIKLDHIHNKNIGKISQQWNPNIIYQSVKIMKPFQEYTQQNILQKKKSNKQSSQKNNHYLDKIIGKYS